MFEQYPFFAPAAVLAAAKSQNNGTETSKAALAVGNTGWLQQILTAPIPNAISNVISKQLADYNKPVTPDQILEIESPVLYHTIDYFASQGIKLREEKLADDQLGKQVKSFTQWLRSMKKIYVEEQKELDSSMEKEVVSIATESNQQTEVITETMAEVLVKQGKRTQAIDLYRKLSLLHPEKSVYFASRIDELKQ